MTTAVPVAFPTFPSRDAPRDGGECLGGHGADPDAIVVDDEAGGRHLFVVDGSRLYELDPDTADVMVAAVAAHDAASHLDRLGLTGAPFVDDLPVPAPPLRALSLAVAQKCNLGCTYCYAQQGDFGMASRSMTIDEADRAVDLLLAGARAGDRVTVAFMGGEPLANRSVLRATTERAAGLGAARGVDVRFSVTTNGTLVRVDDGEFFERHGFSVTISLDGDQETHDRLRPFRSGAGSFATIVERVTPLLEMQRRMQVSARVTVTTSNLAVRPTLDALVGLGFHSVGFAPMLASPTGTGEVGAAELDAFLVAMIDAGREYERRTLAGELYPFANLANALREIDLGTHRPYPCGAGAGYLGVAAGGELAACHRFVGDDAGRMGSLDEGVDAKRREEWLDARHVHRQEPCRSCWARYLCGGGCHHEVLRRGRPACDYIRGWLRYCIGAYARLTRAGVSFAPDAEVAAR